MKKVVLSIALVAVVLIGGFAAYSFWKFSISSPDFLNSGKKYYEEKKYAEAKIQLLNAIQEDAKNREARFLLALLYADQGDLNASAQQLKALLENYPDDVDANLRLGNIYLFVGRSNPDFFREASKLAEKVLSKNPDKVDALVLSGNAMAGLQDYRSSVEQFERAINLDPQNSSAFLMLGATQAIQKNFKEAEAAFLKARAANPKDKSVLASLGNYYRVTGQMDKAESFFKEALALYPADRAVYLQVMEFYLRLRRVDEAEKVLKDAQAADPSNPDASLVLADLYSARNSADGPKLLQELKVKFPENMNIATKLAMGFLRSDPPKARVEIDRILKAGPNNPAGHVLLGELQFLTGEYDAAEATFSKEPALSSRFPQPHFFLGNLAMRKGKIGEAEEHFQKSLTLSPEYIPARAAVAEILLNKGKVVESRVEVRKVLDVQPGYVPARLLKAALDRVEKNYPEADRELTLLLKEQPNNPMVHRQMALYYDSRGRSADAEKSLKRALEISPNSPEILTALAESYVRGKQPERAIQLINDVPADKRQVVHYELLGRVYGASGKPQDAEEAYKKALEMDPRRSESNMLLASQYIQGGHLDDGLKQLDELIKKDPSNASIYGMKGMVYESQGKTAEAKESYKRALEVDPTLETAANNLAYILAEEGKDLNSALTYAQAARKKQPENPGIADTLGWVYYKLGNPVLARDQFKFAVSKLPDNPVFQYHLGLAYKANKQVSEAQSALKKATSGSKDFKEKPLAQQALKDLSALK